MDAREMLSCVFMIVVGVSAVVLVGMGLVIGWMIWG